MTAMTDPAQPIFAPVAFAAMIVLAGPAAVTLAELADRLKESPDVLGQALRTLTEGDYAARSHGPESPAPAYRAPPKGRTALAEHMRWLERRLTAQK